MTTDDLAGILREHRSFTENNRNVTEPGYFICSCGEVIYRMGGADWVTYEAGVRALDANYTGDDRDAHNAIDAALPHIERAVMPHASSSATAPGT